ncbi:MAG: Bacterial extracellular solute-binding protein, family 5 Middle [Chloroflexi bacterium]|nr:Bacterial extracellular solute-binding protein, family 5 Middle [Chloroflexota bacterium]
MTVRPGHWWFVTCAILAFAVAACAPVAPRGGTAGADSGGGDPRATQTLTLAVRYEPFSLASKPIRESGSGVSTTTRLFNAELDLIDGRGVAHPVLAESLPQLNTDSWVVLPDGRMETRYRLRSGVIWHDGTSLSALDFAFAWQVYSSPTLTPPDSPVLDQLEDVGSRVPTAATPYLAASVRPI